MLSQRASAVGVAMCIHFLKRKNLDGSDASHRQTVVDRGM